MLSTMTCTIHNYPFLFLVLYLLSINFLLCRHLFINSSLLLMSTFSFCIIKSFSHRQRSHFLPTARYGWLFFLIENLMFSYLFKLYPESFIFQNYCDNFDLFSYCLSLQDVIWSNHLPLIIGSASPM